MSDSQISLPLERAAGARTGTRAARKATAKRTSRKRTKAPARKRSKAGRTDAKPKPKRRPKTPQSAGTGAASAEAMAQRQRDISVSEFFAKNRHLLGFDNPAKALLTTVKELVDNALDAADEARIPADVEIQIDQLA